MRQYMDDSYIASLFPVVTQPEFAASIARINVALAPDTWMYAAQLSSLALVLVGFILFALGAHLSVYDGGFSPLVAVGFIMFLGGIIMAGWSGSHITRITRNRLLAAIAIENCHYCQKMPPATFRLRESRVGRNRSGTQFNIVIDVGAQVVPSGVVNVMQAGYYQPSLMQPQQPQYVMGAMPMMQPSSPPRFYGGPGSNAVAPAPPTMQQPYGQPQYAQQGYGNPMQQPQYYQQQPYGQLQQQPPQYYNLPNMQQQQSPPAYTQQAAQPYRLQQQYEEPAKPQQQQDGTQAQ